MPLALKARSNIHIVPIATALGSRDCHPTQANAAPDPDAQELLNTTSLPSRQRRRAHGQFTSTCAHGASGEHSVGAVRLVEGRMRRACSP